MNLVEKYNKPVPRYTSYPPVPFWENDVDQNIWVNDLKDVEQLDLYLHIPFCQKLCYYCGCHRTITKDANRGREYASLLLKEWELYRQRIGDKRVQSIHFGGGTPTFLSPEVFEELFQKLLKNKSEEFFGSVEIDPRTVRSEHLEVFKKYGVKRLSLGIQDFDPTVQEAINRHQSYEMVSELMDEIRRLDFESVNFDLIYGLPHQNLGTLNKTIDLVKELAPDMIAFYSYAHVPWKLSNQKLIKEETLAQGSEKMELYLRGKEKLLATGYHAIGMDHFALEDNYLAQAQAKKKLYRNFMGYTDKKSATLLGLGISSISSSGKSFAQNTKEEKVYQECLERDQLPITNGHRQTQSDLEVEKIIQEVMCDNQTIIPDSVRQQLPDLSKNLDELSVDGLVTINGQCLSVTPEGREFVRNIASSFDMRLKQRASGKKQFSQSV